MRIWIDVLDASGNKLGDGPITNAMKVAVKRKLDGVGSISVTIPASDVRAAALLENERRIVIYVHLGGETRTLGQGTIRKITVKDSPSGALLTFKGPDALEDLARRNTLLGREYDDQAISTVVGNLAGLASWTATVDAGLGNVTKRFDGESVLKALRAIAEEQGLHLRHQSGTTLAFGAMGEDSGLRLIQRSRLSHDVYANDEVALIEQISLSSTSEAVANWIVPLGAGEGAAQLTLEHSTRSSPYTIQSMTGPDGSTLYYLSDASSIAAYGQIEAIVPLKTIEPLGTTSTDLERAANMLYDAGAAWLERSSTRQDVYQVRVRKAWDAPILPGDKVRLVYKGLVNREGEEVTYLDTDALYWVLSAQESIGVEGHVMTLKLSNVDREEQDALQVILDTIESVKVQQLRTPDVDAGQVTAGTLQEDSVPDLPASKVASGTLDNDRVNFASPGEIGTVTPMKAVLKSLGLDRVLKMVDSMTEGKSLIGVGAAGKTITLADVDCENGKTFIIKDESGGAGGSNITIIPQGAKTIDGAASKAISANYGVLRVYGDGNNWFTF